MTIKYSNITIKIETNSKESDIQKSFLNLFVTFIYEHHIRNSGMNGFDEFPDLFSYLRNPKLNERSSTNNNI